MLDNACNYRQENGSFPILKKLRLENVNRIIIIHLNINSIRNKFLEFCELANDLVNLIVSETKLDASFRT